MPAAHELDVGAAVEQHLGDPGGGARAVVVEHDDALADRSRLEQDVPGREDVLLVDAGQPFTSGFTLEKPVRDGTAPVATSTPSGASSAHELRRRLRAEPDLDAELAAAALQVARDPCRTLASGRPQDEVDLAAEARLLLSTSVTLWPRFASVSAAFIPAGPPPATSQRAGGSAGGSVPAESRSRPAAGLTVQLIASPLKTRPMQPWLPRMQW